MSWFSWYFLPIGNNILLCLFTTGIRNVCIVVLYIPPKTQRPFTLLPNWDGRWILPSQRKTSLQQCWIVDQSFHQLIPLFCWGNPLSIHSVPFGISMLYLPHLNSYWFSCVKSIVTERISALSRCSVVFMFVDESFNLIFVKGVRYGKI